MLFEIAEYSAIEIARQLGIPLGTVASRLRRAREAFGGAAQRMKLTLAREQGTGHEGSEADVRRRWKRAERRWLSEARAEEPPPEVVRRIERALGIAPGAATTPVVPRVQAAASAGKGALVTSLAALGVGGAVGLVLLLSRPASPPANDAKPTPESSAEPSRPRRAAPRAAPPKGSKPGRPGRARSATRSRSSTGARGARRRIARGGAGPAGPLPRAPSPRHAAARGARHADRRDRSKRRARAGARARPFVHRGAPEQPPRPAPGPPRRARAKVTRL